MVGRGKRHAGRGTGVELKKKQTNKKNKHGKEKEIKSKKNKIKNIFQYLNQD